jgi:hypothetical protein
MPSRTELATGARSMGECGPVLSDESQLRGRAAIEPFENPGTVHNRLGSLVARLKRRRWPLVTVLAFVTVGLAYSFFWSPLVHHIQGWTIPGDIWSTWRAAHWVGWGSIGGVYGSDSQLVTFPGIAVVLAPFAMISGHLGLTESIDPLFLAKPSAWYVLGPASLVLGSLCLIPIDAIAEELGVSPKRRIALGCIGATVLFEAVVLWGHPEDLLALGFAFYGLLASERSRWSLSGWMWGAAIVIQPLSLLLLPLQLSRVPPRCWARIAIIAALPSALLVGTPLLSNWTQTSKVLFHQANFPAIDHPTPWIVLSPHLSHGSVGAGPGRILALLIALGLGVAAYRLRPSFLGLLWLGAVALSGRCFFESVMVPFYLAPPLIAIVLVASVHARPWRVLGAWAAAMVATILSFQHVSEWAYWLPMVLLLGIGLGCAWPGRTAISGDALPSDKSTDRRRRLDVPVFG